MLKTLMTCFYECMILNGLTECGFDDSYTYISKTGSSVTDYFVMSCDLFYSVCVDSLDVGSLIESDHMSVTLKMKALGAANVNMKVLRNNTKVINNCFWNKTKEQSFQCCIRSDDIQDLLRKATDEIIIDADKALDSFVGCLKAASECMLKNNSDGVRSIKNKKIKKKSRMVDEEWKEHKIYVKRLLKL